MRLNRLEPPGNNRGLRDELIFQLQRIYSRMPVSGRDPSHRNQALAGSPAAGAAILCKTECPARLIWLSETLGRSGLYLYFLLLISSRFFAASKGRTGSVMRTGSRISLISFSLNNFFSRAISMIDRPVATASFAISAALAYPI
jgi:hypothetical protein